MCFGEELWREKGLKEWYSCFENSNGFEIVFFCLGWNVEGFIVNLEEGNDIILGF